MGMVVNIREVKSKTSLVKSKLSEFTINPYLGCAHGCKYCYAAMIMQRWHHRSEVWGSFVDVRINTPTNVEKEIRGKDGSGIFISSMCDCYQPSEEKYGITRGTLEKLLEHEKNPLAKGFSITIQTKSALVLRDIDLISQFKDIEVGITITTLDSKYARLFEPLASPPKERLRKLETLNKNGIKTYAFIGPLLPSISDSAHEIHEILMAVEEVGTKNVIIDKLNYFSNLPNLKDTVKELGLYNVFETTTESFYPDYLRNNIEIAVKSIKGLNLRIVF